MAHTIETPTTHAALNAAVAIDTSGLTMDDHDAIEETLDACFTGEKLAWWEQDENAMEPVTRVVMRLTVTAGEYSRTRTVEFTRRPEQTGKAFGHETLVQMAAELVMYVDRQTRATLRLDAYTPREIAVLNGVPLA